MTSNILYQIGRAGNAPDYKEFFKFPDITLREIRAIVGDSFGADFKDSIAVGAVLNDKREVLGELVMVGNGEAFCVKPDGSRERLKEDDKIGFFQLAHFAPEQKFTKEITVNNMDDLKQKLGEILPDQLREAYSVRVSGTFPEITFRSLNTEGKEIPDCCLAEVCEKHQKKFAGKNAECTLTGFYNDAHAVEDGVAFKDLLHLHGAGKDIGGHVLDFRGPAKVTVELMPIEQWLVSTHEHAEEASKPKWVNKIRIPRHMAKAILDMPYYVPSGDGTFRKHLERQARSLKHFAATMTDDMRDKLVGQKLLLEALDNIANQRPCDYNFQTAPELVGKMIAGLREMHEGWMTMHTDEAAVHAQRAVNMLAGATREDAVQNIDEKSLTTAKYSLAGGEARRMTDLTAIQSALIDLKNELTRRDRTLI